MELMEKQGYKQTEVGLIPEDWDVKLLGDIAKINMGQSPLSSNYNAVGIGLPLVQGNADIKNRKTIIRNYTSQITKSADTGDIIMSVRAPVGEVAKATFNCCIGRGVCSIKYNNEYVFQFLMNYEKSWGKFSTGSTFDSVNSEQVKSLKIPLPPTLTEQKAIATALSDVDDLIANLELLITKKKAIKQGAMQQLLTPPHKGGKRLAGFTGEWERVQINKVITVARGGSPRPIQNFMTSLPDGVNWIKIGDTSKLSKYITSTKEKIIPEGEQFSRSVKVGDFLLSNSMSFGRPYILKIDGCIHDGWLVLQNYQEYFDREFLYYTLMSKDVFDQYMMKASGSGVLNLNKELVKVVELNRPKDLKEQVAIAEILSDMDNDITLLETKKAKYQDIKQGMMQELLTGKTRLV
jgi:type I restriction enzyme, S subunit